MQYIPKIQKNFYIYDSKNPAFFNLEYPKDENTKQKNAYIDEHYNIVSAKGNMNMTLQSIGILGISSIFSKNFEKALSTILKQLKLALEKKSEVIS